MPADGYLKAYGAAVVNLQNQIVCLVCLLLLARLEAVSCSWASGCDLRADGRASLLSACVSTRLPRMESSGIASATQAEVC